MAAIVTNKFRINNADQFYESFGEASATQYWLFVGRPQPFSSTTGGGTDSAPPTPLDNVVDEFIYYRDMIAAKRITSSDISYVCPRHTWTTGTIYDYYRGDYGSTVAGSVVTTRAGGTNLWASTTLFYVLNSSNQVWKCMWNANAAGTPVASVNEPYQATPSTTSELNTADGYYWKYLYTLTTTEITNFLTTDFLPVHIDAAVQTGAVNGEILHYKVDAAGTGYTPGTYSPVTVAGDGTTPATVSILVDGSGTVESVTAVTDGVGYTFASITMPGGAGGGSGETITPIIGPKGGHGANAIEGLGGYYVAMNTTIAGTAGSGDFVVDQDFRRIGVVRDPLNAAGNVPTATTLSALKSMTFSASPTPGSFDADQAITGGTSGAKGLVVSYDSSTRVLKYIQTQYTGVDTDGDLTTFAASEVVTGTGGSTPTGTIASLTASEIQYYSGDTIYAENRSPITRAADQTENIKLIIEF